VLRKALHDRPPGEPEGWWEARLKRGKCAILLDGLDEVVLEDARKAATVRKAVSERTGRSEQSGA
jgi:hypothetical protein